MIKMFYRIVLFIVLPILTLGCSKIHYKPHVSSVDSKGDHTIAIFFDGTNNDEKSDTNIKRLHSLVSMQDSPGLSTLYIEGVGTGAKVVGMATGWGSKRRVLIAYRFILDHYRDGDRIFIFGFSRGAFAARILTSMLYHAGVVTSRVLRHGEIAEKVFDVVKLHKRHLPIFNDETSRLKYAHCKLMKMGLRPSRPVAVEFLGLWDTVAALGVPGYGARLMHKLGAKKYEVSVDDANPRYGDKLCNVREVRHALSIDDDREWIFTPRLMTRRYMFDGCDPKYPTLLKRGEGLNRHLKEVWFSGAHSDVGGGYEDSNLSGVSLNWMIHELKPFDLLPENVKVPEDPYGSSHNPEGGFFRPVYHAVNRDMVGYALHKNTLSEFRGTMCVHPSVFVRRKVVPAKSHESRQLLFDHAGEVCLVADTSPNLSARGRYMQRRNGNMSACQKTLRLFVYSSNSGTCEEVAP